MIHEIVLLLKWTLFISLCYWRWLEMILLYRLLKLLIEKTWASLIKYNFLRNLLFARWHFFLLWLCHAGVRFQKGFTLPLLAVERNNWIRSIATATNFHWCLFLQINHFLSFSEVNGWQMILNDIILPVILLPISHFLLSWIILIFDIHSSVVLKISDCKLTKFLSEWFFRIIWR